MTTPAVEQLPASSGGPVRRLNHPTLPNNDSNNPQYNTTTQRVNPHHGLLDLLARPELSRAFIERDCTAEHLICQAQRSRTQGHLVLDLGRAIIPGKRRSA